MGKYIINKVLGVGHEYMEYIDTPDKVPYVGYRINSFKPVVINDNDPNYVNVNYKLEITKTFDTKEDQTRTCTIYIKVFDITDRKLLELPILFNRVKVGKTSVMTNRLSIPKVNLTSERINIELMSLGMERALPGYQKKIVSMTNKTSYVKIFVASIIFLIFMFMLIK